MYNQTFVKTLPNLHTVITKKHMDTINFFLPLNIQILITI
jgi:hypothetical protein